MDDIPVRGGSTGRRQAHVRDDPVLLILVADSTSSFVELMKASDAVHAGRSPGCTAALEVIMADSTRQHRHALGTPREDNAIRKKQLDEWLDQALADTFPASDAVASPPDATPVAGIPVGKAPEPAPRVT